MNVAKRLSKNIDTLFRYRIEKIFTSVIPSIQDIIVETYDNELLGVNTDRKSKTDPTLYRADFINRLNKFNYLEKSIDNVSLIIPDATNFDFSGQLRTLQVIMEGTVGTYVELNEEDYTSVFGKKPINENPIDRNLAPKDRIYIVRYTSRVHTAERALGRRMVKYPFSNTPPIDLFAPAEKYVNNNIDGWIEQAIHESQEEFSKTYKGVKL